MTHSVDAPKTAMAASREDSRGTWYAPWSNGADETAIDLRVIWRIAYKRRWLIAGSIGIALAIGLALSLLATPIYQATVTLQIDRASSEIVQVEGVVPTEDMYSAQEFYQTQYELLKSRSLAQRVVTQLGLANDSRFISENRRSAGESQTTDATQSGSLRGAIGQFLSHLQVTPTRNSRLVTVGYESPDAGLAQQIANAIAENYIASNLDRRFEASSYARKFLEERLQQLRERLETAERELVAYAEKERIIRLSGSGGTSVRSLKNATLESLNAALAAAQNQRIVAEQRWLEAKKNNGLALTEILESPTILKLRDQQAQLTAQLRELQQRFKTDYPSVQRMQAQIAEVETQIKDEASIIRGAIKGRYEAALATENALREEIRNVENEELDQDRRSVDYNILARELDTNKSLYDSLLQRYREIGIAGGVGTNNISIVDRAETPISPVYPRPILNLALAGVVGLIISAALAFGLEYADETLRQPEDIEAKLGLSLMGTVPLLDKGLTPDDAMKDARSAFSEAFHSIRASLQFSRIAGMPKTLFVTSSDPAEGKSTSALAIARTFARSELNVLLIDADLRASSLHKRVGLANRIGLSSILEGSAGLSDALQSSDLDGLTFLSSGPRPAVPVDLLNGPRLRILLDDASQRFDLVVIDGPPIMGLADAPILARAAEATLYVISANGVRKGAALKAIGRLQAAGADIIGAILEKFDVARANADGYGYGYSYSYEYGGEKAKKREA